MPPASQKVASCPHPTVRAYGTGSGAGHGHAGGSLCDRKGFQADRIGHSDEEPGTQISEEVNQRYTTRDRPILVDVSRKVAKSRIPAT